MNAEDATPTPLHLDLLAEIQRNLELRLRELIDVTYAKRGCRR